jgi:quercetin dioxygenase-like cupin family protein
MAATPVIRHAGEGERRWFYGGGVQTWKVTEEESGGAFMMFEDVMTAGKMTPWHSHPDHDELIFLIEGECVVNIGGNKQTVTSGSVWMTPRGTPHAFMVVSETARVLAIQTPGSAQAFYYGASEAAGDADGPVDFDRIGEVAAATGVTKVLGPPPFVAARV